VKEDEREPSREAEPAQRGRKPWFARNRGGAGFHSASWQGWAIITLGIAVIVTVVVLFRTGIF